MGLFSSGSAKRAAAVQAAALAEARQSLGEASEKYGAYYDPYRQVGVEAMPQLNATLSGLQQRISALDPRIAQLRGEREALQPQVSEIYALSRQQDPVVQEILGGGRGFQTSPGYQFALEEGQKALERSRAAKGILNTGGTGRELTRYGQGMANQEYGNYLNQLYDRLNAVNTQLGGRQTALNVGQNQINQGLNLLQPELSQISAQQNLAQQYQALVNSGMSAADAAARLGINVTGQQAGLTSQIGDAYASGMTAKSNQLLGMGQGLTSLAGAGLGFLGGGGLLGAALGGALGANVMGGNQQINYNSRLGTTSQPYTTTPREIDLGDQMPWLNGSSPVTAQKSLSQSSYQQPRYYS